jgi:hypothetical protein
MVSITRWLRKSEAMITIRKHASLVRVNVEQKGNAEISKFEHAEAHGVVNVQTCSEGRESAKGGGWSHLQTFYLPLE